MNRKTYFVCMVLILTLATACGTQTSPTEFPTPVYIPVIVTVGIPVPVTVTPSDDTSTSPLTGPAETSVTRTLRNEDVEEDITVWSVYEEGTPQWILQNSDDPMLDGNSLQCSLTGGDAYSNAHCYTEFDAMPGINSFELSLSFQFNPASTCNNEGEASVVQAIEFTMNKWEGSQRYEFAVQWQNIGEGAPQWRYWDGSRSNDERWVPINSNARYCVEGGQWHSLILEGDIVNDQVHYKSFTIDTFTTKLDLTMPPAPAPNERDRLAVAVQVDGNATQTPYDLFIDRVNFIVQQNADCNAISALQESTEFTFQGKSDFLPFDDPTTGIDTSLYIVEKNTPITWDPPCLMDLQLYQDGQPVVTLKDASSGQYDFNHEEILLGVETEIKVWRGGEIIETMWVRVKE